MQHHPVVTGELKIAQHYLILNKGVLNIWDHTVYDHNMFITVCGINGFERCEFISVYHNCFGKSIQTRVVATVGYKVPLASLLRSQGRAKLCSILISEKSEAAPTFSGYQSWQHCFLTLKLISGINSWCSEQGAFCCRSSSISMQGTVKDIRGHSQEKRETCPWTTILLPIYSESFP